MLALALCGALVPDLAAASPWLGTLPLGPLGSLGPLVADAGPPQPALQATVQPAVQAAPEAGAAAQPAQDERLEQMRGGSDTPWSDMKLSGTVANNSAVNVVTGSNIVTDSAFSNASGLPMVIQNSGANVLIQNATIVNVQIK